MAFKRFIAVPHVKYWHETDSGVYFIVNEKHPQSKFKRVKIVIMNHIIEELKLNIGDTFEIYIDDENPFLFMFKKSEERIKGRVFKLNKHGKHGYIGFAYKYFTENTKHKSAILTINDDGSFIVDCSH